MIPSAQATSPARLQPVNQAHAVRQPARLERIDVLRAGAALSVVGYHLFGSKLGWHWFWSEAGFAKLPPDPLTAIPLAVLSYGWVGVPLFFALSGFCIHGAFLRQRTFSTGVFFWRRFWRIYPPFLGALAVFCFWPISWLGSKAHVGDVLSHVTTAFTLTPHTFWGPFNPSFWSVAVEFQCYLLYPVFLLLRQYFGVTRAALGWFAFSLVGSLGASAILGWPDHAINFWSCASFFSFGGWALGALVAEDLARKQSSVFYSRRALSAAALLFLISAVWRPTLSISFSLAALVGALLISAYVNRIASISRLESLLARIGVASYSLYLWHQPLLGPLEKLGRELAAGLPLNAARLTTYVVIAAGLALITFVSYRLLERPGMTIAAMQRRSASTIVGPARASSPRSG